MDEIIMGIVAKRRATSIQEIQKLTGFKKDEIKRTLSQLAAKGKIYYDKVLPLAPFCRSCPLRNLCKVRRE